MSVIPCARDPLLQQQIEQFAEALKTQAHQLGDHGLVENEFYAAGILRGAIEQIRGEYIAQTRDKHEFARHVLNYMQDREFIRDWEASGRGARNDFVVRLLSGRNAVIDLKGCLDGNNTTIAERPADAAEFIVWSLCTSPGSDPRRNAWSGVHTRLGAEIVWYGQRVDGLVIWDMLCGTSGRPCPKLARAAAGERLTEVGPFRTPPPCIYVFPAAPPEPGAPPLPARPIAEVELLAAFHACFGGWDNEVNHVGLEVARVGDQLRRATNVSRGGRLEQASAMTSNRRAGGARE